MNRKIAIIIITCIGLMLIGIGLIKLDQNRLRSFTCEQTIENEGNITFTTRKVKYNYKKVILSYQDQVVITYSNNKEYKKAKESPRYVDRVFNDDKLTEEFTDYNWTFHYDHTNQYETVSKYKKLLKESGWFCK